MFTSGNSNGRELLADAEHDTGVDGGGDDEQTVTGLMQPEPVKVDSR